VLAAVLGIGVACTATSRQIAPASLAGSRQLVSVTYPAPQQLRVRAPGRDSLLVNVTRIDGWPVALRHDTLDLQVASWEATGYTHQMKATDYTVAVPPDAGATIHARTNAGSSALPVITVLLVVVVGAMLFAATTMDFDL